MTHLARRNYTLAEYAWLEDASPVKHEYLDGVVYAMAGGSPDHARIAANVTRLLGVALAGRPCAVFSADLRIGVVPTGLRTYPDVSVVRGPLELDPEDPARHTVTNPIVLVEVLSPSTEDYDRGEKLAHSKRIASLREVVLVAHDERRVELWRRADERWTTVSVKGGERLTLTSLDCELGIDDLYADPLANA
ncbi:MAG: Uma2 family endonuclease [Sandaracinaceae bacterium]